MYWPGGTLPKTFAEGEWYLTSMYIYASACFNAIMYYTLCRERKYVCLREEREPQTISTERYLAKTYKDT